MMAALSCALALAASGCSDDGLSPPDAAAEDAGGTSGSASATSSVNTSATVTATQGEGDDEEEDDGLRLDLGDDPGGTSGNDGGSADDSTGGPDSGTSGGPAPELPCVEGHECACDPGPVICESLPPECPPDFVPLVDERAQCWEGSCVSIESCLTVPDCAWCDDDEACVSAVDLLGVHLSCQPIDPGCADLVPTCECMPMACEGPFFECVPAGPSAEADLGCVCPTC